jgi:hypothetical protein
MSETIPLKVFKTELMVEWCEPTPKKEKETCDHLNKEAVSAFIYDQIRCSDCGAYIGEA